VGCDVTKSRIGHVAFIRHRIYEWTDRSIGEVLTFGNKRKVGLKQEWAFVTVSKYFNGRI
jgi:hypothetical protein